MPANFKDNFLPAIALKNASDQCSLKKHCRGCLREVMGYLDLLAAKSSHRFVFASVKNITAHCNKFRIKGRPPYKDSMVKKSLAFAREHYLIGPLHERRVDGVPRKGFQVVAHDSVFVREGKLCRAPLYDDPVSFFKGFKSWLAGTPAGTLPGTPQNTPTGTLAGTPENEQNEDAGYTRGYTSTRLQAPEPVKDVESSQRDCGEFSESAASPNRVSRSNRGAGEPGEHAAPNSDQASDDPKTGKGKPTPTPSSFTTDRPNPADMSSQGQTVEQYFERVPNSELIYTLSNTRITPDTPYPYWDILKRYCVVAVKKRGPVQVNSKALADIMGMVIDICTEEKTPLPPREWIAVMKKMREGEPLLCLPPPPPPPDEPIDEARTAAWTAFSERPEQLGRSIAERTVDFEKEWKPSS